MTLVGAVIVAAFLGMLIYGSMSSVQVQCELCVEFRGQRECRRGAGADEAAAQQAAVLAACAVMSSGMNESIACGRTRPVEVRCAK